MLSILFFPHDQCRWYKISHSSSFSCHSSLFDTLFYSILSNRWRFLFLNTFNQASFLNEIIVLLEVINWEKRMARDRKERIEGFQRPIPQVFPSSISSSLSRSWSSSSSFFGRHHQEDIQVNGNRLDRLKREKRGIERGDECWKKAFEIGFNRQSSMLLLFLRKGKAVIDSNN